MQRLNSRGEKYLQAATNKPYVHCGSDENDESHELFLLPWWLFDRRVPYFVNMIVNWLS